MGRGNYDEIDNSADPRDYQRFTIMVIFVEVVGLIMTVLSAIWMSSYHNGFGWDFTIVFNYHPLFMTLGLIYLYGNGLSISLSLSIAASIAIEIF